jgi:hypothetical protein
MKFDWSKLWKHFTPSNVQSWLAAIGGRRFWLTMLTGLGVTLLAWYAKISDEIYRDVTLGTVGAYIIGNTIQKVKQTSSQATVEVAEITGEAPITVDGTGAPIKVELSTKEGDTLGR